MINNAQTEWRKENIDKEKKLYQFFFSVCSSVRWKRAPSFFGTFRSCFVDCFVECLVNVVNQQPSKSLKSIAAQQRDTTDWASERATEKLSIRSP